MQTDLSWALDPPAKHDRGVFAQADEALWEQVGISDQLSARPDDPSAKITSNKTLVMATCAEDGHLLQPSYPIVPIERMITGAGEFGDCFGPTHRAYTYGCGAHVWATYTAVSITSGGGIASGDSRSAAAASVGLWWTAIGFFSGRGGAPTNNITLREDDLAPMVRRAIVAGTWVAFFQECQQ